MRQTIPVISNSLIVVPILQGHRLIAQFLRQPLLSKEKLEERFDVVQMLIEDFVLNQSLREEHLRKVLHKNNNKHYKIDKL